MKKLDPPPDIMFGRPEALYEILRVRPLTSADLGPAQVRARVRVSWASLLHRCAFGPTARTETRSDLPVDEGAEQQARTDLWSVRAWNREKKSGFNRLEYQNSNSTFTQSIRIVHYL